MKQEWNFWVLGGDQRQAALANALAEDGHRVRAWALEDGELDHRVEPAQTLESIARAHCVIFPLPMRGEGERLNAPLCPESHTLAEVFSHLGLEQYICGGRCDAATTALAGQYGLTIHDYFTREELAVANAVPAALAV